MSKTLKLSLFLPVLISCSIMAWAQESNNNPTNKSYFTLSGTIKDAGSFETVIGATIVFKPLNIVTQTNNYGFYSIKLPQGRYEVVITHVNFTTFTDTIALFQNITQDFRLSENRNSSLENVVVTARKNSTIASIKTTEISLNKLSMTTVKKMPVVMGESDILKSITTLPGVTNAGEGQSGFNVRGGSADQNLILLDEATIFNTSHLLGLISVFNTDAIKDLKLYKGGIPTRYGGRLSSVLEVFQKDGNKNRFSGTGGIGTLSSRLMIEGPLNKGKGSYVFAGRTSYANIFLALANQKSRVSFYDINTKINYQLNDKNQLFLSGYFGEDGFSLADAFSNPYGNIAVNLRWNHLFSKRIFSNLSLIYSAYNYGFELEFADISWKSNITNYNLKYDINHTINAQMQLNYGLNALWYDFNPGKISPLNKNSTIVPQQLIKKHAIEPALYLDAKNNIGKNLIISYGVRYSCFARMGEESIFLYKDDRPASFNDRTKVYEKSKPIGTRKYKSGEAISEFENLEPRATATLVINNNTSVKASYNRMAQYMHLITNTQSPTPLDVWMPSGPYLKPQISDQVSIGFFKNLNNNNYSVELEAYYKKTANRIDYIDGAEIIANDAIEQTVLNGRARAYGVELLVKKNTGKLTGWVSYTLSKAEQQTPGRNAGEPGINNGKWYLAGFDKTHNLNAVANYERNKKWRFGAIFTLQSGQPSSFPSGQYTYDIFVIPVFGDRNSNRLPLFHHLDISATYTPNKKPNRRFQGEFVFSIYNVYNRQNAASYQFKQNQDNLASESLRTSIFGAVPSVTYNFRF